MKKYEDTKKQHGSYYWLYKKHWKLLLMDVGNSSYVKVNDKKTGMELSNLQIIDYMLELDDELRAVYDLKEAYREFNKLRNLIFPAEIQGFSMFAVPTLFFEIKISVFNPIATTIAFALPVTTLVPAKTMFV